MVHIGFQLRCVSAFRQANRSDIALCLEVIFIILFSTALLYIMSTVFAVEDGFAKFYQAHRVVHAFSSLSTYHTYALVGSFRFRLNTGGCEVLAAGGRLVLLRVVV